MTGFSAVPPGAGQFRCSQPRHVADAFEPELQRLPVNPCDNLECKMRNTRNKTQNLACLQRDLKAGEGCREKNEDRGKKGAVMLRP